MSCKNNNEGVLADNGMVVSARQEASKIGVDILKKGGVNIPPTNLNLYIKATIVTENNSRITIPSEITIFLRF